MNKVRFRFMVVNATFNNISGQSVLLVKETRVSRENHRPVASHWQTLSNRVHPAMSGLETNMNKKNALIN